LATSSNNYKIGLPSELAILAMFDPRTGAPKAILDASGITDMRTGAVTAVGANIWRGKTQSLGHIGAVGRLTGTCVCSTICRFRRDPRAFSPRGEPQRLCGAIEPGSRQARGGDQRLESCVRDADIVVEASRLLERRRC